MQTVLITGAASGIGRDTARLFAKAGWQCVLVDHNAQALRQVGETLMTPVAAPHVLRIIDLTDATQVVSLNQGTPLLDAIINNAVTYLDGSRPILEEADLSICARTFEVNAVGPLRVAKYGLPLLRKGKRKLLVNVSSEAGSIGDCKRTTEYAYCMSKSALNMGSKLLQNQLAPEGIKVLALHPGWFNSSGQGPAPLSAEEAAVKVLATILKAHRIDEAMYVGPEGNALPW